MNDRSVIDDYRSLEDGPEIEHRVKSSRFLGRVFHATEQADAAERLGRVRRRHHAARHHCWAICVGPPDSALERCDDDGEPTGTAGRPILQQIRGGSLYDVLVVVTRYFGGTRLGTGGLTRAYSEAARLALDAARPRLIEVEHTLRVEFEFDDLGVLEATLARAGEGVRRVSRVYDPRPRMRLSVRPSRAAEIAAAIVESTGGRAIVTTG